MARVGSTTYSDANCFFHTFSRSAISYQKVKVLKCLFEFIFRNCQKASSDVEIPSDPSQSAAELAFPPRDWHLSEQGKNAKDMLKPASFERPGI